MTDIVGTDNVLTDWRFSRERRMDRFYGYGMLGAVVMDTEVLPPPGPVRIDSGPGSGL